MGWLFGKRKKVPQVPFPEGRTFEEGSLRLPRRLSGERVIEPDLIKAAAGLEKPLAFPDEPELKPKTDKKSWFPAFASGSLDLPLVNEKSTPLYVKMEVYQRILSELDGTKTNLTELQNANKALETSEYNEENNFVKLRRAVKNIHDRLLLIDKTIFKTPGE